jgi:tRNA pseudouridine38-40 synthase
MDGPGKWLGGASSSSFYIKRSAEAAAAAAVGDGGGAGASEGATSPPPPPPPLVTHSFRLTVAYDGTAYSGWQLQPKAPTIQSVLEAALATALREPRETLGASAAGRTDAGVHAAGQVVQFRTLRPDAIDTAKLPSKLNSLLPWDVRVLDARATAPDFNVTVSATGKVYHYTVDTGAAHDPLAFRTRAHAKKPLDVAAMRAAAALLVGTHDFTQFSNETPERLRRNPVKTLRRLDVVGVDGGLRLEVEGSGFLYKQVRHMTGALLAVGEGKLGLDAIAERLAAGNSRPPGAGGAWRGYNVAPAKGLCLRCVQYPPEVDDPNAWLYPDLPHDEWGRLVTQALGGSGADSGGD